MAVVDRVQFILEQCTARRVLHLGCADAPFTRDRLETGRLLHASIATVATYVVGVDTCEEGLELMRRHEPSWELEQADACTFVPEHLIDVVVAAEIVEHLECPGELFRGLRRWAAESTSLVVTTPNAYSLKGALRALAGREYAHPDHVVHFSTATLRELLARTGWRVETEHYYFSAPTRRAAAIPALAARAVGALAPRVGDGMILVARPQGVGEQERPVG